jgi:hypothetical protein
MGEDMSVRPMVTKASFIDQNLPILECKNYRRLNDDVDAKTDKVQICFHQLGTLTRLFTPPLRP